MTRYVLYVAYDLDKYEWGSLDNLLQETVGQGIDGAGTGFGQRDIDWSFETKKECDAAAQRLRKLKKKHLTISMAAYDDDDDDNDDDSAAPVGKQ